VTLGVQPLPEIGGPLKPIGPVLERELALLFERHETAELPRAIVAWAFERGLVLRSSLDASLVHVIVTREGASRAARVVDAPQPQPPPPRPRGQEWTTAMPARRK
jgi:hypothetical protein